MPHSGIVVDWNGCETCSAFINCFSCISWTICQFCVENKPIKVIFLCYSRSKSANKFVQCFTIKTKSSGNSTVAKLQRVSFAFVDHVLTFFLIPLVPLLRLQRAIKSRFLCVKTIDNSIKKFSYNEHPLITTNFCIFYP